MKGRFLRLGSNSYKYSYTTVWWGDAGAGLQSEHSAGEMCHHSPQPSNLSSRKKPSIHKEGALLVLKDSQESGSRLLQTFTHKLRLQYSVWKVWKNCHLRLLMLGAHSTSSCSILPHAPLLAGTALCWPTVWLQMHFFTLANSHLLTNLISVSDFCKIIQPKLNLCPIRMPEIMFTHIFEIKRIFNKHTEVCVYWDPYQIVLQTDMSKNM